ncbi:MAG: hypothetical protein GX969_00710 [Firmicutes bacterium]|nr:hypothetical protein [Bacillota bacterium]
MSRKHILFFSLIIILTVVPCFCAFAGEVSEETSRETVDITADELVYDRKGGLAVATGNVEVLSESFLATSDSAEYVESSSTVTMKGNVRYENLQEEIIFLAEKIIFSLENNNMEAKGDVFLNHKDGEVIASGEELFYFSEDNYFVIKGNAYVDITGKVFQADIITVFPDEERVIAEGGTKTTIPRDESSAGGT